MDWIFSDENCLSQHLQPGSCTPTGGPLILGGIFIVLVLVFAGIVYYHSGEYHN